MTTPMLGPSGEQQTLFGLPIFQTEKVPSVQHAISFPGLGTPVFVDTYICQPAEFIRWKRNHRKSRINKKWHKRYGAVLKHCSGVAYELLGRFVVCPHVYAEMRKSIGVQS